MSGERIMLAIGNISDKYVMESFDVAPFWRSIAIKKWLPAVACFIIVIFCAIASPSIMKNNLVNPIVPVPPSTTYNEGSESDAPIHFYLNGMTYIADPSTTIVTEIPDGYSFVGTIINVGDLFSKKDFEGNISGAVYLSKDKKTAYVEASCLEKVDGKNALILCKIEK